jgi:hypothetical protein
MADFHDFLWQRDDSLRRDESNDGVKFLCHNSKDNPFNVKNTLKLLIANIFVVSYLKIK